MNQKDTIISANRLSRSYKILNTEGGAIKRFFSNDYKYIQAVKEISFHVNRGEIVGFIGPNGAGKSTTIKMMTGILVPSEGEIEVLGRIPHKSRKENAKKIGVVFGQRSQLWWDLPLSDTFQLLKNMYKIPDKIYNDNMNMFLETLELQKFMNQPVRQLSLGQRMRGEIAAALLHNPEILFLDEPTIGLDIVAKQQVREFIRKINKDRNVTVILTTHDMKDVENICDRILLINHGKVVVDMPIDDLKNKYCKTYDIRIRFSDDVCNVETLEYADIINYNHGEYVFRVEKDKLSVKDLISYYTANYNVLDFAILDTDIEEIIKQLYQSH